jgi:hypothetical protein
VQLNYTKICFYYLLGKINYKYHFWSQYHYRLLIFSCKCCHYILRCNIMCLTEFHSDQHCINILPLWSTYWILFWSQWQGIWDWNQQRSLRNVPAGYNHSGWTTVPVSCACGSRTKSSASLHTPILICSLVLQVNNVQGVQIKRNDIWFPVSPVEGVFIVNIRDNFEVSVKIWTSTQSRFHAIRLVSWWVLSFQVNWIGSSRYTYSDPLIGFVLLNAILDAVGFVIHAMVKVNALHR